MNIYLLFLFDISNETQTLGQQKQSIVLGAFFIFAYFCIENKDEYLEFAFYRTNICRDLYKKADTALYLAKKEKGQLKIYKEQ